MINNICKRTEIHLGGSSWWYSKHIPINFIEILLPFPVNCPRTIIFWLIFRYQSFSLQNTISSKCAFIKTTESQICIIRSGMKSSVIYYQLTANRILEIFIVFPKLFNVMGRSNNSPLIDFPHNSHPMWFFLCVYSLQLNYTQENWKVILNYGPRKIAENKEG
jgi:hypothetical protein